MNFVCHGGRIQSINDGQTHSIPSHSTMSCFLKAICLVDNPHVDLDYTITPHATDIHLRPRADGNYSMVDELFEQFIPSDKWASVAISGKDGKPFYIKDKDLRNEIIMRCETSIIGVQGNNYLLNKIIDDVCGRPKPKAEESSENWYKRYNEWKSWWGAKPHILDINIFNVSLFSTCCADGCTSFVNPKNGKVGLLTNCRWSHESIKSCREELEWICNEICDEENELEFYVSFFNEDVNFGKCKKEYKDPQFTFKLSHKGIELVPRIPIKNLKWIFKCNQRLRGKEWKKVNFLWGLKKVFRNLQKKFFYEKWVIWHNYTLMGNCLNNIMDLSERYYTVDEIIRMIEMWRDECIEYEKKNKEDK